MSRLFGTDGVRGLANVELTAELALHLGAAAAQVLVASARGERPLAIVGRDPRLSGEMLEAAVTAGLASQGVDVDLVGVLPTPALAYLVASNSAALGVMISASHNAMPDNGIKFFAAGGLKLDDSAEDEIEARLGHSGDAPPCGAGVGRIRHAEEGGLSQYVNHVISTVNHDLSGIKLVVDSANGAASNAAPAAYRAAGAEVIAIHSTPDGLNINDNCGSTHLGSLQHAVKDTGAHLGLAHDGDADRCLAIAADGSIVDGDAIMAILALSMAEHDELVDKTLVATVMSNLGLHVAMKKHGLALKLAAVGDRYVLEEIRAGNYALGGEQSGHIIMPKFSTTGDGILTGLQIMSRMAETGQSLAKLASVVKVLPQVLINVKVDDKNAVSNSPEVRAAIQAASAELGESGRVLLRPSGTEQLFRIMVEAQSQEAAQRIAMNLAEIVKK